MLGFRSNEPMPQFIDRFLGRTAWGLLIIAIAQCVAIGAELLGSESPLYPALSMARTGLGIATILIVLPVFFGLLARRSRGDASCQPDGFIVDAFRRAGSEAFTATFIALLAAKVAAGLLPEAWTTELVLRALLAVAMAAFAIAFFRRVGVFDAEED